MKKENSSKQNKFTKGFTLLELLVVVLIIGILVAIALPQYKKAVEKSKATQALTVLQSIYQSAEVYQLATGNWPSSLNDLDVDIPHNFKESEHWDVIIRNNIGTFVLGTFICRISGKYAGTCFVKYKEHPYSVIPKETNLCVEYKKNFPYIFNGEQGSYCSKIFNGKPKYIGVPNWADIWVIP